MTITVYKLGGSLLSLPDLPERIVSLLSAQPASRPLIVVGGGPAADLVREWDRQHHLGDERAHRLALKAMMLNEALLVELMPTARLVACRSAAAQAWSANNLPVLCAYEFLQVEEAECKHRLPHTWDVTSDSIAAWIAHHWPADRLVLLKSTSLTSDDNKTGRKSHPPVDISFQKLASRLPDVGWVNLRNAEHTIQPWLP